MNTDIAARLKITVDAETLDSLEEIKEAAIRLADLIAALDVRFKSQVSI